MLRKSISYKNFEGQEVTEEHYFHMTKAELIKAEVSQKDGLRERMLKVVASGDAGQIIAVFEDIVKRSYGRRTEDGRFVKREIDWEEFLSSEAYSTLFMELVTNATAAAEFVRGIMPDDVDTSAIDNDDQLEKLREQLTGGTEDVELPAAPEEPDNRPAWIREDREPDIAELMAMSKDELVQAMQLKNNRKREGV